MVWATNYANIMETYSRRAFSSAHMIIKHMIFFLELLHFCKFIAIYIFSITPAYAKYMK